MPRIPLVILLPVALLATGAVGAGLLIGTRPQLEQAPAAERVWVVEAAPVRLADVQPDIQLFGKIFAAREIQLRALVPGQVVELHPDLVEGGVVRSGELILAIDEFEYQTALKESEARLAEAEARVTEREARRRAEVEALESDGDILEVLARELERAERLAAQGTLSAQALDQKRLEFSGQERAVALRRNGLDALTAQLAQDASIVERLDAAVERARYDLERTRLHASFDGVFRDVAVQVGQRLGTVDLVGGLIDLGQLEARFHLSDAQYGRLVRTRQGVIGRPARVIWRLGSGEVALDAEVARVGAQIDAASGGVELFARIEDPAAAAALRPGAFVEILLPDQTYTDVALMPETVLHPGDVTYGVEDGRLVTRRTEVVARVDNDVLLRGELADGDRLVTTQSVAIAPGLRVELD